MTELEEQVAAIVKNAIEDILRLVGRDEIEVEMPDFSDIPETPTPSRHDNAPSVPPRPKMSGSRDPILDNFLGTNR